MNLTIRPIDPDRASELDLVARRCMDTVLETIPEFEGREDIARSHLSNFTLAQMTDMIRADLTDPAKRIMLAVADDVIAGQALYSVKTDRAGTLYGFCFSRYVLPEYRRNGIAAKLLTDALEWFKREGARYVIAQTHVENIPLQHLFEAQGFTRSDPQPGIWRYYVLTKEL
jgi:ribosomal protein S18 acetylase RimI-like enzyme